MNKVILIIIDGCRPDGLQRADTPNIDRLIDAGVHTFTARTVTPSITLPAHFSIFTSNMPYSHNVLTNAPGVAPAPSAWSLIDLVKYHGKRTAAFYSWEQLRHLSQPGSLDMAVCINSVHEPDSDMRIAEVAASHLSAHAPDFCFVYLERTDYTGHEQGFMSEAYVDAIEAADRAVGMLVTCIEGNGIAKDYHFILHSDHGGNGFHHQEELPEVMTVPWIAAGPKIKQKQVIQEDVSIINTAPTIARLMNIRPHWLWKGKPLDIFENL
jgi:predicted AlkP superfamily pyrophosphatase or phosphodiesterase